MHPAWLMLLAPAVGLACFMTIAYLAVREDRNSYRESRREAYGMYHEYHSKWLKLQNAIARHKKQTGQNLCWENDVELWQALEESVDIRQYNRPPCEEFLPKCIEYWKSRKP